MKLESLKDKSVEWLKGGPDGDVVVSSQVSLVRNVEGFPFTSHCSSMQRARVEELLRNVITASAVQSDLNYFHLNELGSLMLELMVERRLVTEQLAEAEWERAVAFDSEERVSLMVNELDHLRFRVVRGGFQLQEACRQAERLDEELAEEIPFAFSERYGYLTARPTEVGTGMRASVMLHLPAVVMSQEMDNVVQELEEEGLALQGLYGEGSHGVGDFYQVCNRVTLGVTEEEIVATVGEGARRLMERERSVRATLHEQHPARFRERIQKAYELARSSGQISSEEALNFLSQVRLGSVMNVLPGTPPGELNGLFLLTLPAHLQTMEGRLLDTSVRNVRRARYVSSRLSTG